ncbi:MAG: hypothetical protein DA443_05040 [Bacteroidetes bacterium]|nr:MAG: hypothetical protein DA443_05040 [Bacteroidota bacterium]
MHFYSMVLFPETYALLSMNVPLYHLHLSIIRTISTSYPRDVSTSQHLTPRDIAPSQHRTI